MTRLINLLALSFIGGIFLTFTFSMIDTDHTTPYISEVKAACDLAEFSRIETEFQNSDVTPEQIADAIRGMLWSVGYHPDNLFDVFN